MLFHIELSEKWVFSVFLHSQISLKMQTMSSDFLFQDKFSFLKIYQKWHLFVPTTGIRQLQKFPVLRKLLSGCILSYILSLSCFYLTLKLFHLGMFTQFWENSKWSFDEEAFQKPWDPVLTLTPHPLSICLLLVILSYVFLSFLNFVLSLIFFFNLREGNK